MAIHPTAIIESGAQLGVGVEVGAYSVIGSQVRLGDRCKVSHHASITGKTDAGPDNAFFPFVSIGEMTQDLKYKGEPTYLYIGAGNVFREFTTVNRGTNEESGATTTVGDHNVFLAYNHIAHDCKVGSHCIFSNNATLGGHVVAGDHVTIGGMTAIHQFCRVGSHAMLGGCTKITQDVPPFCLADGNPAKVRTVNIIGLRRHGFSNDRIRTIRSVFDYLYDEGLNTSQALLRIQEECDPTPDVQALLEFVRSSDRGIIR